MTPTAASSGEGAVIVDVVIGAVCARVGWQVPKAREIG
jgi:hypothetical protein